MLRFQQKSIQATFELVRAGLWEKESQLLHFGKIDYGEVLIIAEEQALTGLVTAGLEYVSDVKVPKEILLQFIGESLQIEQRNKDMNMFLAKLIEKLRKEDIYAILLKGQGIAQCYENPLWRVSGDVDLLMSNDNFEKAKNSLLPLAANHKQERYYSKELNMTINQWSVELHGSQRTGLSSSIDRKIDVVQKDIFYGDNVRSWQNGKTTIFLPSADNDVFFVFTHFLKHFFKEGGVTLRQICDWCRLLWTYREQLDSSLLESRIKKVGLISEWRAFAAVAVDYLGMPVEAMPLYRKDKKWSKKADKIIAFILKGGEWRKLQDTLLVGSIFPLSTLRFAPGILLNVNWLKVKESVFGDGNR